MLLVAHRTPRTRAACEAFAEAGAQFFEADIQLDARERIVVSHYLPWGGWGLQRDNWRVRWHEPADRDPTLDDVVAMVPQQCRISLDMKEKTPDRRERLIEALIAGVPDRSRFVVCGGRPPHLERLRDAGFRTWRSVGTRSQLREVFRAGPLEDDAVSVRHSLLTADVVARLHEQVPSVVAWTVNNVYRARRLREFAVDGVTSDRPSVLRALAADN